jgi:hypothetical protein
MSGAQADGVQNVVGNSPSASGDTFHPFPTGPARLNQSCTIHANRLAAVIGHRDQRAKIVVAEGDEGGDNLIEIRVHEAIPRNDSASFNRGQLVAPSSTEREANTSGAATLTVGQFDIRQPPKWEPTGKPLIQLKTILLVWLMLGDTEGFSAYAVARGVRK